jgi:hypothetical protein
MWDVKEAGEGCFVLFAARPPCMATTRVLYAWKATVSQSVYRGVSDEVEVERSSRKDN